MSSFRSTKEGAADIIYSQKTEPAIEFAQQAEKLGQHTASQEDGATGSTRAVEAKFITPCDPVVETANGGRLPAVPLDEAIKLNKLKRILEDDQDGRDGEKELQTSTGDSRRPSASSARRSDASSGKTGESTEAPLDRTATPSRTHPLFPALPMYGPPTALRVLQSCFLRTTSAVLSLCFLLVIILGAAYTSIPLKLEHIRLRLLFRDPDSRRPFYEEEKRRRRARKEADRAWTKRERVSKRGTQTPSGESQALAESEEEFVPTEGGPDPLVCDVAYYARRVGLDAETLDVQTEDGFIIELWHIYNPLDYRPLPSSSKKEQSPDLFTTGNQSPKFGETSSKYPNGKKKYPVLMMHGLLQSAGAYCCNDDDSLAFFLAKSGYDVWLGNNRCGFEPRHTMLSYGDPRMWAWNIRQMGVMDLPALISRVLAETGFPKLALIAHSQGTTETFVALAKQQRPDIGSKISVFCALAPAAYAGSLVGKMYFKFMRVVPPSLFRVIFGIHAFIPFMMSMHKILPGRLYGAMGYRVFSFLFNWTDARWERDLRDRMFQFAPVYVSAESMRWWLGRECFARQKCILATRDEGHVEDKEDEEEDQVVSSYYSRPSDRRNQRPGFERELTANNTHLVSPPNYHEGERGQYAWYDERMPPLAMWVAGNDDLVDGRRLLRRFDRGREPHVRVVHKKIIEGYEHLDVIWAMDAIDKVGKEVREVIWRTAEEDSRRLCRTPKGCEGVFDPAGEEKEGIMGERRRGKPSMRRMSTAAANGARAARMRGVASVNGGFGGGGLEALMSPTYIDSTHGNWAESVEEDLQRVSHAGVAASGLEGVETHDYFSAKPDVPVEGTADDTTGGETAARPRDSTAE